MTVFEKSRPEDAAELLDMLNLTFSMAHCPHDFKKVRPQAYLHPETSPAVHYIAREDGRILRPGLPDAAHAFAWVRH